MCSFLSLILLFFLPNRCVSPLDLPPPAGPRDSFSTAILKRAKLSPPPCPSFFPLPILSFPELRLPLLDCLRTKSERREGMKLVWNLHSQRVGVQDDPRSACLSSPGGGRGEVGRAACPGAAVGVGGWIHRMTPSGR